jgi:hypothetical protein
VGKGSAKQPGVQCLSISMPHTGFLAANGTFRSPSSYMGVPKMFERLREAL